MMIKSALKCSFILVFLVPIASSKLAFNLHLDQLAQQLDDNSTFTWPKLLQFVKDTVDAFLNPNLLGLYKISKKLNISTACQASLFKMAMDLRALKEWSTRMADASGKIPSGILEGTVMDFGSYDECINIHVNDSSNPGREEFRGRYCMVGYHSRLLLPVSQKTPEGQNYSAVYGQPPEWASEILNRAGGYLKRVAFWFGTCVPSTCSAEDVRKLSTAVTKPLGFIVTVSDCQVKEPYVWPTYSIVAVSILSFIICLCAFGTLLDVVQRWRENRKTPDGGNSILNCIKAFSLLRNTEKLFGSNGGGGGILSCFDGIRFLSATWIILGHSYFYTDTWKYLKYRHLLGVEEEFNGYLPLAVIENFPVPVGSFFFMSGFLLVFTSWKKLEKNDGNLNLFLFFIHKYWRMTPALGLTILLLLALPLIDSGPLWNSTLDPQIKLCKDFWWGNFLYINNWWNTDQYCLIHTWYLAALMQFHIVGVILLLLTFRWRIAGLIVGCLLSVGCFIFGAILIVWHNFPMPAPGRVKDMDVIEDYTSRIHIKPFSHLSTYLIGMTTAYIILKYRNTKLKFRYQILGWTLATCAALASVYGVYGSSEDIGVRAFYIVGHRLGWALSISWLVYACATGMGGIINRFLSWGAFSSLGQLSYLIYLVHPLVIIYRNASLRERVYYGHTELVFSYLGNVVVSIFIAYLGYIAVETPFGIIENTIFRSRSSVNLKKNEFKEDSTVSTCNIKNINP